MKTIALLLLLIAASQVHGQARKPPIGTLAYDSMAWVYSFIPSPKAQVYVYTGDKWEGIKSDSCESYKLEIQTLLLLNDSLTRRLKEQIEYRAYTSNIIKCISTRNKMGDIRVYFKDQWGGRIAFLRYEKRYKNN